MDKKTTLLSVFIPLQNPKGVFIGKMGTKELYGAARQILARGSTTWPRKRSPSRGSAAVPGRRALRRLLRAARLFPYRLHVPVSGFGPLVLTKQLSKVNGYICRLLITN